VAEASTVLLSTQKAVRSAMGRSRSIPAATNVERRMTKAEGEYAGVDTADRVVFFQNAAGRKTGGGGTEITEVSSQLRLRFFVRHGKGSTKVKKAVVGEGDMRPLKMYFSLSCARRSWSCAPSSFSAAASASVEVSASGEAEFGVYTGDDAGEGEQGSREEVESRGGTASEARSLGSIRSRDSSDGRDERIGVKRVS